MRTRRGLCYPRVVGRMCSGKDVTGMMFSGTKVVNPKNDMNRESLDSRKRQKRSTEKSAGAYDFLDTLPDDLILSILCKLSSTATCPSDFVNVLIMYVINNFSFLLIFFSTFPSRFYILATILPPAQLMP